MHDYSYRIHHSSRNSIYINRVADVFELVTNIFFTIEIFLIILVYTFNPKTRSQLFTILNLLLTTVLISSWISYSEVDIEIFNVWKHFRILTIFRLFPELAKKVNAFFDSFKHLGKTFFPLVCVILFYAVVGISFFRGHTESRCRLSEHPEPNSDIWEVDESTELPCGSKSCPENSYCRNPADYGIPKNYHESDTEEMLWGFSNFDDIFNALFSVYNFLMINGWIATTNIFWRAQEKTISAIYFVSLVLLLSQIFSNIVLATLYEGYMDSNQSKQSIKEGGDSAIATDRDHKQQQLQPVKTNTIFRNQKKNVTKFAKQIHNQSKLHNENLKKKGVFQMILLSQISNIHGEEKLKNQKGCNFTTCLQIMKQLIKKFRKSQLFGFLIFINIIGIIIVLCLDRDLNKADFILTMMFFTLSFLEFISMGVKKYFGNNLLLFDSLIILLHIISYIVEGSNGQSIFFPESQYYIFVRWTKMLRSLRLFNDFQIFGSLKILMRTYYQTLKSLPEFLFLWVLLIVLFAQIGRELLAGKDGGHEAEQEEKHEMIRINYNTLEESLIAVIMICFNEEWQLVMYKYRRIIGYKSVLFHFFTMLLLQVLFVRLFIGIFINVFMRWLRENEILLYHSQTTIILSKLYKKTIDFLQGRNRQVRPSKAADQSDDQSSQQSQQQLGIPQNNKNNKQQSSTSINQLIHNNQPAHATLLQQLEKQGTLEQVNGLETNFYKKEQTLFMKRLKEKNKLIQQKAGKVLTTVKVTHELSKQVNQKYYRQKSSAENHDNPSSLNRISRKMSAEIVKGSTRPSLNRLMRSRSNDNLMIQKSPYGSQDGVFGQNLYDPNNFRGNTQSQASTTNNHIIYNISANDKSIQNEDDEQNKMNGNSNQLNPQGNNLFLFTPEKSLPNIFIHENNNHNNQIQDINTNQNNNVLEDFNLNNQHNYTNSISHSNNKPHHHQIPSISIQSPINGSYMQPILGNNQTSGINYNSNSQQYNQLRKQDNQMYIQDQKFDKISVMSSDSLRNPDNTERQIQDTRNNQEINIRQNNHIIQQSVLKSSESEHNSSQNSKQENIIEKKEVEQQNQYENFHSQESQNQKVKEEEYSLFLFSQTNKIRQICKKIVLHQTFDYFNVLSIIALAILLIIDTPFVDPNSDKKNNIIIINAILTALFISENIIQIIAYGFIFSPSSFIQRNWIFNSIDIITTVASFFYTVDFWERSIYYFKFILIFRLSVLLSFLSQQVKEIHHAGKILVKCLPRMIRLILFAMMFLLISGVLTTKLLKGSMNHCYFGELEDDGELNIQTKSDCLDLGGDWIDSQYNFNNIVNSLQILFMVQSSEGWIHIMFNVYDSTSPDHHSHFKEKSLWVLFFIQFFFIANICMLNMFVGLVVETQLEMIESEHKTKDLHKFQKEWLFIKESIYQLKPSPKLKVPFDRVRSFLFKHFIEGNTLKIVFYTFTLANCINLMLFKNRQSQDEIDQLYIVNEVCLVAMVVEVFCRLICLEEQFFIDPWNVFDAITVIIGWINLRLQQTNDFEIFANGLRIYDGIAKGLQLFRFYRIMKHFTIFKKLFKSLQYAVSSIYGIFLVLVVFLFISVLVSMNIFPYLKPQKIINGYDVTFKDFPNALFTLIRVMTSEYWYVVASESGRKMQPNFACFENIYLYEDYLKYGQSACGTQISYIFFYGFYLVFTLVILNIFIATIIESYKEAFSADESAVNHYQLDDVLELWKVYDPDGKGYISYKEFWQFSSQIAIIYGVKSEDLMDIQNKNEFLKTLNIPIFEDPINKIFCYKFHDVVISISKVSVQIKYGITTLEPEDPYLRQQLDSLIKKSKLKGDNMIKPTTFTSADMVLIIVLTRKVKQWKQKSLKKQDEFIFDIKQLTQKLRSQVNKSQMIEPEDLNSSKDRSNKQELEQDVQEFQQQQLTEQPQIDDYIEEQEYDEQYTPITIKSKLPNIEKKGIQLKNSSLSKGEKNIEKNVKFVEDLCTKPANTEEGLIEMFSKDQEKEKDNQDLILISEHNQQTQNSLHENSLINLNGKNRQVIFDQDNSDFSDQNKSKSVQQQSLNFKPQEFDNIQDQSQQIDMKKKKNKKPFKFSIPQQIKANSVIQEDEQREDDFGMDINFNDNFILAFNDNNDVEEEEDANNDFDQHNQNNFNQQ